MCGSMVQRGAVKTELEKVSEGFDIDITPRRGLLYFEASSLQGIEKAFFFLE